MQYFTLPFSDVPELPSSSILFRSLCNPSSPSLPFVLALSLTCNKKKWSAVCWWAPAASPCSEGARRFNILWIFGADYGSCRLSMCLWASWERKIILGICKKFPHNIFPSSSSAGQILCVFAALRFLYRDSDCRWVCYQLLFTVAIMLHKGSCYNLIISSSLMMSE